MKLSNFRNSDKSEVRKLFTEAFSDSEGPSEGALIGGLVQGLIDDTEPEDILGFVASENDQIVGGIFFTRLLFDEPIEAFILSPVAVHSKYQGKGVGQALINFGIAQLQEKGVKLVFTYGDPNYYSRVGFESITEDVAKAPLEMSQPEGWLCQSLDGGQIDPVSGSSTCVNALNNPVYW